MNKKKIALEVFTWLITLFVVAIFFRTGMAKFAARGWWVDSFRMWGYPDWFRIAIGVIEVGGLLMLWPRVASYVSLTLAAVMVGAVGTLINATPNRRSITPVILIVLCCTIAALRWNQRLRVSAPVAERHADA